MVFSIDRNYSFLCKLDFQWCQALDNAYSIQWIFDAGSLKLIWKMVIELIAFLNKIRTKISTHLSPTTKLHQAYVIWKRVGNKTLGILFEFTKRAQIFVLFLFSLLIVLLFGLFAIAFLIQFYLHLSWIPPGFELKTNKKMGIHENIWKAWINVSIVSIRYYHIYFYLWYRWASWRYIQKK